MLSFNKGSPLLIDSWQKFKKQLKNIQVGTQITIITKSLSLYKVFVAEKIIKTRNEIILTIAFNDAKTIKQLTLTPQSFS